MPLNRRAMGSDDFVLGNLHALTVEGQHLELATVRALREGTDDDGVICGEGEQSGVKRPVMRAAEGEAIAGIIGAVFVLRHEVFSEGFTARVLF